MTRLTSPSLVVALLERLVPDSEALAGDLLEQFEYRRSIAWLWWQVAAAIVTHLLDRQEDIRPLRLVDLQPVDAIERSRTLNLRASHINLTASPVNGAGGLTLVLLAVLLTQVASGMWWVLLASIVAGAVFGVLLIAQHRGRMSQQSSLVFDGLIPRHVSKLAVLLLLAPFVADGAAQTAPAAQDKPSRPAFEVTYVKPNSVGTRGGAIQPGRFAQSAVTLRQLVRMAYGTNQIVGGPGWIDSEWFDVEGRGPFDLSGFLGGPDGSPPRVYLMLQQLLEDRFKLRVHMDMQERPIYALVSARRDRQLGPQLQRSTFDCDAHLSATVQSGRPPAPPPSAPMPRCAVGGAPGHLIADSIDMSRLANVLTSSTDRVVLNRTNLNGRFNVELQWTPDLAGPPPATPNANAAATDAPPALVTAIQEQLGLKLEPETASIEVLVIDRVDRPTPN
jgi:uncharacterized protein (TIGR03435 family)